MNSTPDPKTVKAVSRALAIQHTLDRGYGQDADVFNFMVEELTPQFMPNALAVIRTLQEMGWRCVGEDEVVAPREPTHEITRAMSESVAVDDGGAFPSLCDLLELDFSGENKTHTVLRAAYRAAIAKASPPKPEEAV
jgi:phosphoserine phosphatase